MIEVSVIIPVYNSSKYLAECISSLLLQRLQSVEFIFINNGSTDNSQSILEKIQKKDARIRLINQANTGVSAARNAGLQIATGEYVGFVDADDTIAIDFYERLHNKIKKEQSDIVCTKFVNNKATENKELDTIFSKKDIENEIMPRFLKEDSLNSVCNKLYRKALIREHSILFPVDITNGEDRDFNIQTFSQAEYVLFTNYSGYVYRENEGSATKNIDKRDYFDIALKVYQKDNSSLFKLGKKDYKRLKAMRFINKVTSLIYIYFNSKSELSFFSRYKYVKKMVTHPSVQEVVNRYWPELMQEKSKYTRYILRNIRSKSIVKLFIASYYSKSKNK